MCFWIKKNFPQTKIVFLCKNYTVPVLKQVSIIDQILTIDGLFDKSNSDQLEFFNKINADGSHTFSQIKTLQNWLKRQE